MLYERPGFQARRRSGRRYAILLFLVMAMIGGWIWFWSYGSAKVQVDVEGWRAREARAGRVYDCGTQTIGGFPFRFELNCDRASVQLRSNHPPLELKAGGILVAAQVYDPTLIISEFTGPLTVAEPGRPPRYVANWQLGQSSVRGTPRAPQRVSIVFDRLNVDRMNGELRENLLHANRTELHGRIASGTAADHPVVEIVLRLGDASLPGLHPAAVPPIDAEITAVLRGLKDFAPKPWPARFREIQEAGGQVEISQARVQQGETLAIGAGVLTINANGRLDGQLRVTVAGLEPFLKNIGAERLVQQSSSVNRLAGTLDKLLPGLGDVARQGASANISLGINLLGEQTTLDRRPAVTLPLRVSDGAIYLGPIPVGKAPDLFAAPN